VTRSSGRSTSASDRAARAERGRLAERIVADYLVVCGYTIVARNLRLGRLEIDIVARKGAVVSVVEVRTRGEGSYLPALGTISKIKQARLLRAADRLWRDQLAPLGDVDRVRIDVAAVYLGSGAARVEYIEGAVSH
jgi:putative endonuclease